MKKINTSTKNDVINKVNDYFDNLGLTAEGLGLKTNRDKVMYFHNYMDYDNNAFCGIIEIPNLYHFKLLNMLCKTEDMVRKYLNEFYDKDNVCFSIGEFKRYIKSLSTEAEVKSLERDIIEAVHNQQWNKFSDSLQVYCLEPIDAYYINCIVDMINIGLESYDIIRWHKKHSGKIVSLVTFSVDYIKVA